MTPQKMNGKSLVVTFLKEDDLSKLMTTEKVMPTPDSELSPDAKKNNGTFSDCFAALLFYNLKRVFFWIELY